MVPGAHTLYPRAVVAAWRAACRYRTGTLTARRQLPRMLPIIEKHEPVPSDDGTMLVTLSDGRREWSVPVTVVRHRGRLASHVYRAARARGVDAQRRAANNFRAPPAVTATAGGARNCAARRRASTPRARAGQCTCDARRPRCRTTVTGADHSRRPSDRVTSMVPSSEGTGSCFSMIGSIRGSWLRVVRVPVR